MPVPTGETSPLALPLQFLSPCTCCASSWCELLACCGAPRGAPLVRLHSYFNARVFRRLGDRGRFARRLRYACLDIFTGMLDEYLRRVDKRLRFSEHRRVDEPNTLNQRVDVAHQSRDPLFRSVQRYHRRNRTLAFGLTASVTGRDLASVECLGEQYELFILPRSAFHDVAVLIGAE